MRKLLGALLGVALIVGVPATNALAQTTDKLWKACTTSAQSPDAGVAACSKLLARGDKLPKGDQVIALLNRGVGHYSAQRYQESIDDNSAALSIEPNNAIALSNRGDGFYSLGKFEDAVNDYTASLTRDSSKTGIYQWRGNAYFSLGRYEEAIKDFDIAISNAPQSAGLLYDRGRSKAYLGRQEEALADYDAAIAIDGNQAAYHLDRGISLHTLRRLVEAEAAYNTTLSLDSRNIDALSNKAGILLDKGDPQAAEAGYRAALAIDEKNAYALSGLGNALIQQDKYQDGLVVLNQAIASGNATSDTYADRARVKIILGQADASMADANEAIRLRENNSQAYYLRGLCKRVRGDFEGASADLDKASELDPENIWAVAANAELLVREENEAKARAYLDKMLEISARQLAALGLSANTQNDLKAFRGWARAMTGDEAAGRADLDALIENATFKETALYYRGVLHYRAGDYANAAQDFAWAQGATKAVYSKAQNRIERARALEKLNKWPEAKIAYEEALQLMPAFVEARIGLERVRIGAQLTANSGSASAKNSPEVTALLDQAAAQPPAKVEPPAEEPKKEASKPVVMGKRVALVIGNSGYQNVSALPNPKKDAERFGKALEAVGFTSVTIVEDLTNEGFNTALRKFARAADGADWALVYYAGHGIEVNNTNYLVPVDATLAVDRDLEFEATPLDRVVRSVEGATKLRMVILDACRENPFDAKMARTTSTRSVSRGLARVEPDGGTLIAYSAKAGQVALDGDGDNSPFVTALTTRMQTPGLEIGKLFRLVRDDVMAATGRKQEPFLYGSLPAEDIFMLPPP